MKVELMGLINFEINQSIYRKIAVNMNKEVLKKICKKTFLSNLERDLQVIGIPVVSSGDQFVSNSFRKSRAICRALLQELSNCNDFFLFLERDEIDDIVDDVYREMECRSISL